MANITPVNLAIGRKIASKRAQLGLSMKALGESLTTPVTFQQIQKYERGKNRVSGEQLLDLARVFCCNVADLYPGPEDLETTEVYRPTRTDKGFFRDWNAITNPNLRRSLRTLVADISQQAGA